MGSTQLRVTGTAGVHGQIRSSQIIGSCWVLVIKSACVIYVCWHHLPVLLESGAQARVGSPNWGCLNPWVSKLYRYKSDDLWVPYSGPTLNTAQKHTF